MSAAARDALTARVCADCGGALGTRLPRRSTRCARCRDLRAIDAGARAWARRSFVAGSSHATREPQA